MRHQLHSVTLPTGVTLPYVEQGDAAGTPVIFLHGVTDSWRSFELILPSLPESVHALALTQRGHGDAERPKTGYRSRDFAADVAAFAEALKLGPVIVVGHSMGATNAQKFAIDFPERIRGLVLAGSFASYLGRPDLVEFWETGVKPLTDPVAPAFVREFQQSTLAQPVPDEFFEMVCAESLKLPARVWQAAFAGFMEDEVVKDLGKIKAPTLIIWGERDNFCSRSDQDALLSAISGSRLVTYAGAGHALHWEQPERFASDVAAFVEEIGAA
jgi:pimeloyl-ACP methyl ester carboxylesterase